MQVASSLCSLTQFLPANLTALRFLGRTFATLPLGESVVLKLSIPCLLYIYLFCLIFRYDDIFKSTIRLFFKMKMFNLHSSPVCFYLPAWHECVVSEGLTVFWFLTLCASCGASSPSCSYKIHLLWDWSAPVWPISSSSLPYLFLLLAWPPWCASSF